MKRKLWILVYLVAGIAFWLPSIGAHAVRGNQFGGLPIDLVGVIILPVVASWGALELLVRKRSGHSGRGAIALWMLLGIWMLGPLCTMIGASFSGGGFIQPGTWHMILLGLVLFVPLTFMMSTYDGTLAALAVVSVSFMVTAVISLSIRRRQRAQADAPQLER